MIQNTVLIADDNVGVRKVLMQCLGGGDRCLLLAADGDSALALARTHLPDLIILDVGMPGRDGYQVCAELRGREATRRIPVLMLSGLHDYETAGGVGADGYLSKPFNLNELESRVRALLARKTS
jgi:two-component system phosphate regulon response regulator PhoB